MILKGIVIVQMLPPVLAATSHLQSPFLWETEVLVPAACEALRESLCLCATAWATLLEKLRLGFSIFSHEGRREGRREGRAALIECYMLLLPGLDPGCSIINEHR